jgi:hypothetical protein
MKKSANVSIVMIHMTNRPSNDRRTRKRSMGDSPTR